MHYCFAMSNSLRELDAEPPGPDGREHRIRVPSRERPGGAAASARAPRRGSGLGRGHPEAGSGLGRGHHGAGSSLGRQHHRGGHRGDGSLTAADQSGDGTSSGAVGQAAAKAGSNGDGVATVQSVDRAVSILEILARSGEAGVTEIARELGVHKSTAFRLVAALERRDLVEQNAGRGKYRLGTGILRLAGATTSRLDLVQESRAVARRWPSTPARRSTSPSCPTARRSTWTRSPARRPSSRTTGSASGSRCTRPPTARFCSARSSAAEVAARCRHLRSYTANTITTLDGLMRELDEVRARGYAIAIDELEIGLTAVAAPIRNIHGEVVASMSISGPTFRLDARRVPQMAEAVVAAAHEVSRGWAGRRTDNEHTEQTRHAKPIDGAIETWIGRPSCR